MCSFFLEKKKEPKKNLSPSACLYEGLSGFGRFMGFYIGKGRLLSFAAYLAQSQRRLLCSRLCPSPRIVIFCVSGYRAPGFGFLRCFSPAVCSPLRRLRAYSAELVRAPPYIKVERENCPPDAIGRYSHRCIGRARHKLKRARQLHRIYPASV